jgi:hypothetical protein
MHAIRGQGLGVVCVERGNAWPRSPVNGRNHDMPDSSVARALKHRVAVGCKTRIIDVRMAVSEFEHSNGHPEFEKMEGFDLSEYSVTQGFNDRAGIEFKRKRGAPLVQTGEHYEQVGRFGAARWFRRCIGVGSFGVQSGREC